MIKRIILFLVLYFSALGIGGIYNGLIGARIWIKLPGHHQIGCSALPGQ